MDDKIIDIFGYIGSSLVSVNLIPQIITIIKKKSGKNISYLTCSINIVACGFMLFYGYSKQLIPVIICNGLILFFSIIILTLKKYYNIVNNYSINQNNIMKNTEKNTQKNTFEDNNLNNDNQLDLEKNISENQINLSGEYKL